MSNQDQLSVVVTAFEQWRKNRTIPTLLHFAKLNV